MTVILLYFLSFLFIYNISYYKDISLKGSCKINTKEIVVCFFMLFVFFGFRDLNILNDTNHYYQHFYYNVLTEQHYSILDIDIDDRFEPGFLVYENIVARLFDEPYAIICVSALIITLFNLYNISRLTNNVSLVLYFLFGTILLTEYSGIRQGLATCISTTALILFLNGKRWYYYPLILLASTIHTSSIILLLFPLMKYVEINIKNMILAILSAILIFYLLDSLIGQIGYQDSVYLERSNSRETFPLASFMNFTVASLFLFFSFKLYKRNHTQVCNVWWWISILNVIVLFLDMRLQIMSRFSTFFYTLSICLWLNLLQNEPNYSYRKRCLCFMCTVIFVKVLLAQAFRPEWNHLYPYSFYEFTGTFQLENFGY